MEKADKNEALHDQIAARIKQRMDALGQNPRSASIAAGLSETYLKKFFARKNAIPKDNAYDGLARALKTTAEWLRGKPGAPSVHDGEDLTDAYEPETEEETPRPPARISASVIAALVNPLPPATGEVPAAVLRSDVRGANIEFPAIASLPTDVPVYGTAAGSMLTGAFQFEGGVIEYVRRPPALDGIKTVYGLYIEGTSMVPEHNPGDLRFAHTTKQPRTGDSVIVQVRNHEHDRTEAFIGHFRKKTSTELFLGKLNPEATVQIKLEYVIAIHKVLTINEMFGV